MSKTSVDIPPMKRGWMRKLSRSGLMKNWQTRYFVLYNGKISYYQDQTDRFPYGDNLKGEMDLYEATVNRDLKKYSDRQIYIMGAKGQKDMLVETESVEVAADWADALAKHTQYASRPNRDSMDARTTIDRQNTTMSDDG